MTPVSVGPDFFSPMGMFAILVVVLIVLAAVTWRKGWLGPETEAKIKAKRDQLKLELSGYEAKLTAIASPSAPVDPNAALLAATHELLTRGVITQEQYDATVKKLAGL